MLVYICKAGAAERTVILPTQEYGVCASGQGEWIDSATLFEDAYAVQDLIWLLIGIACMFSFFHGWAAGNQR